MAAGGLPCHDDEIGIGAVFPTMLANPAHGVLQIDQRVGKRGVRAQPIVHAHTQPALRSHPQHQRNSLLALVADHPAATVDLKEDGTVRRR